MAHIQIGDIQLRVGDEVAIEEDYSAPNYILATIRRITPTGQIVVVAGSAEYRFDAEGREKASTSIRRRCLIPVTDEIRVTVMRRRITYYKWEKASPETIMQIARLLGLTGQQGE